MKLTASDYLHLSKLLDTALDLPDDVQSAWIDDLDTQHEHFKPILRVLLKGRAQVETANFLDRLPTFSRDPAIDTHASPIAGLEAAALVGPYRLIREIGRGGMAVVWLAERSDGMIARAIALKLPFSEVNGRRFMDRFARERQILSALTHARIATLYDAGVTPVGQPYLSMQFVDGQPITDYCDEKLLDVEHRVVLFLQVLDAVQYAHGQLVLHRDLKPSNILVTTDGHAVLLDFGIAKLLVEGEARATELTHLGGGAMTPAYASPEQLSGVALGTGSDVYALGVILYELLTGERPYRLKRDSRAALEDAILVADAVRPSQSTGDLSKAAQRGTTPKKLAHALKGDIDTILLKALKKNPLDRYRTADALAGDLQRWLEGKPVLARSDSLTYLTRKFVSRHRLLVGVAGIVVASLGTAAAIALWEVHVAHAQASLARYEAQKAKAVQTFLLDLFKTNTDAQPDPLAARQMTARQMLDVGAQRVQQRMQSVPQVQEAVEDTLANMYVELGLDQEAGRIMAARTETLIRAYGERDPRVAEALVASAQSIYNTNGYQGALPLLRRAEALLDRTGDTDSAVRGEALIASARFQLYTSPAAAGRDAERAVSLFKRHPSPDDSLSSAYGWVARSRYLLGDYAAAEANYRAAIDELAKLNPPPLSSALTNLLGLAEVEFRRGRIADAEAVFRSALVQSLPRNGDAHVDTIHIQTRLGALLHATSRREEGRRLLLESRKAIERDRTLDTPNLTLQVDRNFGLSLLADGQFEMADAILTTNAATRRTRDPGTITLALALRDLGLVKIYLGQNVEAQALIDEGFSIWRHAVGEDAEQAAADGYLLAQTQLLLARGDPQAAKFIAHQVATRAAIPGLPFAVDRANANIALSRAYGMLGRHVEAQGIAQAVLDSVERTPERKFYQTIESDALSQLGQAQRFAGNLRAARANLEQAVSLRSANDDDASPLLAQTRIALAECLLDLGERTAALHLQDQAERALAAHPHLADQFTRPLRALLARSRP